MNRKYFRYVSTLLIVIPMTLIMAFVGLLRNYGFGEDWAIKVAKAWSAMLPIACVAAFLIIPVALQLTEKLMKNESNKTI